MNHKRSVTQEEPLGCGIACVAYICEISYKTAKKKYFKNNNRAITLGYFCKDLVTALSKAGKSYSFMRVKKKPTFKNGTIVFISRSKRYPMGHYLVKTDYGWMNPWINFPDIKPARSCFSKKLPGKPVYMIFPMR